MNKAEGVVVIVWQDPTAIYFLGIPAFGSDDAREAEMIKGADDIHVGHWTLCTLQKSNKALHFHEKGGSVNIFRPAQSSQAGTSGYNFSWVRHCELCVYCLPKASGCVMATNLIVNGGFQ